jgi:two-component system catabolic regulation response regulator CreB
VSRSVKVLAVEDDPAIVDALSYALRREGMDVEVSQTVREACERLEGKDLVLLDLGLPDGSGFAVLDAVRRTKSAPRVIVLTSRDEEVDCVACLESGADDYVVKPFSPRALVARVRAVLRRSASMPPLETASAVTLLLDEGARNVSFRGNALALTRTEFDLLASLARAPGRVKSRSVLVEEVWGPSYALGDRTVDSHVKGLRKKLEEAGAPTNLIETVRGVGFRLIEEK